MAIEIDYYITMVSKNNEIVNLNAAAKNPVRPRKNTAEGGGRGGEFHAAKPSACCGTLS